jgi:hypothetical protein
MSAGIAPKRLADSVTGISIDGFVLDTLLTQFSPLNREQIGSYSAIRSTLTILSIYAIAVLPRPPKGRWVRCAGKRSGPSAQLVQRLCPEPHRGHLPQHRTGLERTVSRRPIPSQLRLFRGRRSGSIADGEASAQVVAGDHSMTMSTPHVSGRTEQMTRHLQQIAPHLHFQSV